MLILVMSINKSNASIFRIIDANLNRLGEGLRVIEDLARMILNDSDLTQNIKTLRHNLIRGDISLDRILIQARNAEEDVGINLEVSGELNSKDLSGILIANSRRAQESLRVLEEISKLHDTPLDSEKYKQARFTLYTLERNLLSRILKQDKIEKLKGLYIIIDTSFLNGQSHIDITRKVIDGGAKIIQLRDKTTSRRDLFTIACQLKDLCSKHDVLFIINDYLDLTLAVDADGLHIGQHDLPLSIIKKLLPIDKIIGCSASNLEQSIAAKNGGADYIGFGAIYPTASKQDYKLAGLQALQQVRQEVNIPIVAIGGINNHNIKEVMKTGSDSAAVISAILQSNDPEVATRNLIGLINNE
jgi:thiamine-phosphate pyrophosphorylase